MVATRHYNNCCLVFGFINRTKRCNEHFHEFVKREGLDGEV